MTLEAQLLNIIEQQQQVQQSALERLEAQNGTITQLQGYNSKLAQQAQLLSGQNSELTSIIKKLQNPQLSQSLLNKLESDLQQRLQSRLEQLVSGLQIETTAKALIAKDLPHMVQAEINAQIRPLAQELKQDQSSLNGLIRELSEQL